jgi:hypothetical protein
MRGDAGADPGADEGLLGAMTSTGGFGAPIDQHLRVPTPRMRESPVMSFVALLRSFIWDDVAGGAV